MERFLNSAKIYMMKIDYSVKELNDACVELTRKNGIPESYIRPIAYSAYGEMGLNPMTSKISVAIASWEWGPYLGKDAVDKGVRAAISSWIRVDPRALPYRRSVRPTTPTLVSRRWRR